MTHDVLAYMRGYETWRSDAALAGYRSNFRSLDVLTTAEFATTDTGAPATKQFFNPGAALKGNPLYNTSAPSFKEGGNVPTSSMFGIYAMQIELTSQYGTITQMNTILAGLAAGKVTANIGNQPFVEWQVNRFLQSYDAGWAVSNDAAATPLVARSNFQRSQLTALPCVKTLNPGAQLSATLQYNLASIPVAFNATLCFHMFAADQGDN